MGLPVEVVEADSTVPLLSLVSNTSDACCVTGTVDTPGRELPASLTDADASAPRNNDPGTTIPDAPGVSVCPAIT